jgi:hypothetical protein
MNSERSEVRRQTSELNPVKGRGPTGALHPQLSIELHIEELVLNGFAPGERYVIGDAVEHELTQLLSEQGVPISLRSESATDEISGATFNAAHNARPHVMGRRIAQAVYQGFGK